ncbi:hypothetical protein B0H14DRAFT_3486916 [Mycena olivaceomarginata]|nr:hypothetical protein B0H14DRAFT_3486916 [Mycena olivaceomarginata]
MSVVQVACTTCLKLVNKARGGLEHHYQQSRDPCCIALYQQELDYNAAAANTTVALNLATPLWLLPGRTRKKSLPLNPPPPEGGNLAPKHAVDDCFVQKPHVTPFGGKAGAPLPRMEVPAYTKYTNTLAEVDNNPWAPFKSQIDWQIACWAKVRGSTSTAFSDLLAINGVTEDGSTSFHEPNVLGLVNLCKPTVWLKTTEINQMLELLNDNEMLQSRGIRVVPSDYPRDIIRAFEEGLDYDHLPRYQMLRMLSEAFAKGDAKEMATIVNVDGNYWVALIVDSKHGLCIILTQQSVPLMRTYGRPTTGGSISTIARNLTGSPYLVYNKEMSTIDFQHVTKNFSFTFHFDLTGDVELVDNAGDPNPSTPVSIPQPSPTRLAFLSPMKGKVKRAFGDRNVSSPPASPVKKKPNAERAKVIAASRRVFEKETDEEKRARELKQKEKAERRAEQREADHVQKARDRVMAADEKREAAAGRKRKERERRYAADVEAGIRNGDFTLAVKKRLIVTPALRDESSSDNIAELSRPARQIENRYKEKHRTHRSGQKKGYVPNIPRKACIVKDLQARDRETFASLKPTTVQARFERDSLGGLIWKKSVLEAAKLNGNTPGTRKVDERTAYREVVETVKQQLSLLRGAGAPLNLIAAKAPEAFEMRYSDGSYFTVSDPYCRAFWRTTKEWSERKSTKAAQPTPKNWVDITGVVYNPGAKFTWAPRGSPQVAVIGTDEKRAFTTLLAISLWGKVLPVQAIYVGATNASCPMSIAPKYTECAAANFRHLPFKTGNHWATLGTMEDFVIFILDRYFGEEKKHLGLPPDQKSLWILDSKQVSEEEGPDDSDISPAAVVADVTVSKKRRGRVARKSEGSGLRSAALADDINVVPEPAASEAMNGAEEAKEQGRPTRTKKPKLGAQVVVSQ